MSRQICFGLALCGAPLLAVALSAAADESIGQRLAACTRETDATAKLACFEALSRASEPAEDKTPAATQAPTAAAGAPPAEERGTSSAAERDAEGRILSSGNWTVEREKDSLTDKPRVLIGTRGTLEMGRASNAPILALRCYDGKLDVAYVPGSFLGFRGSFGMMVRFGETPPVAQTWPGTTNGQAVYSPDPRGFTDRLSNSSRLILEATAFNGERYRAAFDLAGMDAVLPEVASCRRPPQPAQPRQQKKQS